MGLWASDAHLDGPALNGQLGADAADDGHHCANEAADGLHDESRVTTEGAEQLGRHVDAKRCENCWRDGRDRRQERAPDG